MSDDTKDDFMKEFEKEGSLEDKKKAIEEARVNVQYEKLQENKERLNAAKNGNYGVISDEEANKIAEASDAYMEAASKSLNFISPAFKKSVPFFPKNLILVGAKTGEGKTTAVVNIVRRILAEPNPATCKLGRVLILTNEESREDFYNRITCLIKGWHYVNHDLFTPEQREEFSKMIKVLRHRVTVIDDTYLNPTGGTTTTPEGIESIFQNLINAGEIYDAVILDYYQGVNESSKDMAADEYKAQRMLTNVLEKYRKIYPAPIVVMAQINPPEDPDRPSPFQVRIQGTKKICTRATTIIEMITNKIELFTEWFFHKGRYASSVGESVKTGYRNGVFVKYDEAFKAEVAKMRENRENAEFDKQLQGIKAPKKVEEPVNG